MAPPQHEVACTRRQVIDSPSWDVHVKRCAVTKGMLNEVSDFIRFDSSSRSTIIVVRYVYTTCAIRLWQIVTGHFCLLLPETCMQESKQPHSEVAVQYAHVGEVTYNLLCLSLQTSQLCTHEL